MRGRDIFARYENVLIWLSGLLKIFPASFVQFSLESFRQTPGLVGFGMRYILLRRLARKCGKAVSIYPGAYLLNAGYLELGDYVSIHQMCYLESFGGLSIGANVAIAHGASIITLEHDFHQKSIPMRDASVIKKPVVIEDDVWIGAGAKILAGVTIGKSSVIGAGAVVTCSIPEFSIAAGVPARVIAQR